MRLVPSSLRSRLTVAFTLASTLLIVVLGVGLYVVLDRTLLGAIDSGLQARVNDLAVVVTDAPGLLPEGDPFAQVIAADGHVFDQAPGPASEPPVLTREQVAAVHGNTWLQIDVRPLGGQSRVLAAPVSVGGSPMVLVVGSPMDFYHRNQVRMGVVLVVTGPVVVGSLAVAGWLLAGAALRPVRRLTQQTREITVNQLDRRLPTMDTADEIEDLARTLNEMLERIEASVAHERQLIDDASHELRTPISIVRGELELALARPDDRAELLAGLGSALEETVRLGRLSDDLLVLARAGVDGHGVAEARVELAAAATRVSLRVGRAQLVQVQGTGVVSADPGQVDQILVNLLANAVRFADSKVVVLVTPGVPGEAGPSLTVCDDGPGFAASMLPVTFGRFVRPDVARGRRMGGTGLGLAITAALVHTQGATIEAGNGPPLGGAVVRVQFRAQSVDGGSAEYDSHPG